MAGKTFSGIGVEELLQQNPPLDSEDATPENEDGPSVYSGPTVAKTFSGLGVDELLGQNRPLGPEDATPENEDGPSVYSGPTVAKTFSGLGVDELLGRNPPLGPEDATPENEDIRGVYSGPTVVDEDKVAEGLERLRSLGTLVDPAGEVVELVADSSSSEPTRLGTPHRATAVGRSAVAAVPGQQLVVHNEHLRGTMFGHSIHRPDVLNTPVDPEDLSPSGPLYVPPSQARPATMPRAVATQMVPYQAQTHVMPDPPVWQGQPVQPFPRGDIYSPLGETDLRTETIPPMVPRKVVRTVAFGLALVLLGGGAYAFMRHRAETEESTTPPPPPSAARPAQVAAAPIPPSAAAPAPQAPPAPPVGELAPSGASRPTAPVRPVAAEPVPTAVRPVETRPPAAREPQREAPPRAPRAEAPAPEAAGDDVVARRKAARAERRRAAAEVGGAPTAPELVAPAHTPAPAPAPAPPKPSGKKRTPLEEDPDATLPPSSLE